MEGADGRVGRGRERGEDTEAQCGNTIREIRLCVCVGRVISLQERRKTLSLQGHGKEDFPRDEIPEPSLDEESVFSGKAGETLGGPVEES